MISLPQASCPLEWCLQDYTRLEILNDCICRKCSMLTTHKRLLQDIKTLEEATRPEAQPSASKKRRLKEVYKMERQVRTVLEEGRIEEDLRNVRMDKVFSKASSKQAMIARVHFLYLRFTSDSHTSQPPPVLALHINRSIHYGHYASKNPIQVIFPEVLDLTPYTTSGNLSIVPTLAISTPAPSLNSIPRSTTPTPATYAPRTIYRLSAVVCHFGQHSFGHYICYRRKPRSPDLPPEKRWAPPRLVDPLRMEDDAIDGVAVPRYVWEDDDPQYGGSKSPGRGWLRISDDSVRECGIETVLQEGSGAFMLYYERALPPAPGITRGGDANMSEETLKPEVRKIDLNLSANGSVGSFVSEVGVGVRHAVAVAVEAERKAVVNGSPPGSVSVPASVVAPRIVRSVATGRKRSLSVTASDREMSRSMREAIPTSSSLPNDAFVHVRVNGSANPDEQSSMTASAPSLLSLNPTSSASTSLPHKEPLSKSPSVTSSIPSSPSPLSSVPLPSPSCAPSSSRTSTTSSPPASQHHPKRKPKQPLHPPSRTHTPNSQPPQPPAVVGLKA
jgi:ubiquitin carboxyl-terminal hydrolase 1